MKILYIAAGCVAIGLGAVAERVNADGPIREGLRATGEVAAEGAQAVAQGTGQVLQGAGQAAAGVAQGAAQGTRAVVGGAVQGTRAVVGGAADATRAVVGGAVDATGRVVGGAANATGAVVGGAARGVAAGVDAITPGLPLQARAGARLRVGEDARDARWRFAQHRGEWWYYSPENSWMYHRNGQWNQYSQDAFTPNPAFAGQQLAGQGQFSGAYGAGYRGSDQGAQAGTRVQLNGVYQLRHDAQGREFIIERGRRIYFEGQGQSGMSGGQPQPGIQPTPAPAIPQQPNAAPQPGLQGGAAIQGSANGTSGQAGATTQLGGNIQAGASATAPPAATPALPTQPAAGAATSGAIQGSIPQ
jgi:hypothetical protein